MATNTSTVHKNKAFNKRILVTGAAGFIGYHTCEYLLNRGDCVIGVDNLNDYYDVNLKLARLKRLKKQSNFSFRKTDLIEKDKLLALFQSNKITHVINLAAQAGVRYSIDHPDCYIQSNIVGFSNILECCRQYKIKHLVFASSSSVYGSNTKQPFSENDKTDHPLSLYAATKKSNELMAHAYASLYQLPVTGLRFFTVYGPWGRPDMALFKFTQNILNDTPIDVYNQGKMIRDFTYIADIVNGVIKVLDNPPMQSKNWNSGLPESASSCAPYQIYNIANSKPESLMSYISALENALGRKAKINYLPMQNGDVLATHGDIALMKNNLSYFPCVSIESGIQHFVDWYREYYCLVGA